MPEYNLQNAQEAFTARIKAQISATEMWVDMFHQYKDFSSVWNALLALGKFKGLFAAGKDLFGYTYMEETYREANEKFYKALNEVTDWKG